MKNKLSQSVTYWLGVAAIGLVVGLSLQFVRAWTEPAVAPPGGNVGAPINTGDNSQWKLGNLALNTNGTYANGLIVANGNVGIGTVSPGYPLTIRRSTVGKALVVRNTTDTSNTFYVDANGSVVAPWLYAQTGLNLAFALNCSGKLYTDVSGNVKCGTDEVGSGGTGTVTSITAGTGLSASPNPVTTTGTISLNTANANTWTGAQTFNANTNFPGSGIWNTSGNVGIGTADTQGRKLFVNGIVRATSYDVGFASGVTKNMVWYSIGADKQCYQLHIGFNGGLATNAILDAFTVNCKYCIGKDLYPGACF